MASINQTFPNTNQDPSEVRRCSPSSSNNLQNSGQSLGITVKDLLYARPAVHDENQEAGEQSENFNFALYSNINHEFIFGKITLTDLPQDKLGDCASEEHCYKSFKRKSYKRNKIVNHFVLI